MKLSRSSILLKILTPKLLIILGLATKISASHMLWAIRLGAETQVLSTAYDIGPI